MSYEIIHAKEPFATTTLHHRVTGESITLCPEQGGTVVQIRLLVNNELVDVLAPDTPAEFNDNPLFRGRLLFPFNDRIPDATYTFDGQTHVLASNCDDGSAIHGFVYRMKMTEVNPQLGGDSAALTLVTAIQKDTVAGYPFDLTLQVTYRLSPGAATLVFHVENTGSVPAPYALGWHPYFAAPDNESLHARYGQYVEVDDALLPTGKVLPCAQSPFDFSDPRPFKDAPLDLGFTAPQDGVTELIHPNHRVRIAQDTDFFPYTQLFVPDDARSIAIEPITACTNSFNMPSIGRRILNPGSMEKGDCRISLHAT